jgi:F-type H+-transporting ATPase subunit delta
MRNPKVARRYAKALFDMSVELNQVEAVRNDMDQLSAVQNAELNSILFSPVIKNAKKVAIFNAVFGDHISKLTKSFFNLVFEKGREMVLREIIEAFNIEYRKYMKIEVVKVTTAEPISDSLKDDISKKLQDHPLLKGKIVMMESKVDPNIIGGFVVEMDNDVYDVSIRRDLQVIKKQFVENMYVSKIIAS